MREASDVEWILRIAVGAVVSGMVAVLARRLKALAPSGAWAAWLLGTVLFAGGGWSWLLLVGAFFVPASMLTRFTPPGGDGSQGSQDLAGRRWDQVVANGGVAAAAAVIHGVTGWPLGYGVAAGAIAAAAADTYGTEVGRWSTTTPRLIINGATVPRGTSGGVTAIGTIGEIGGAVTVAAVAAVFVRETPSHLLFPTASIAGVSGALLDSILGATIEDRVPWIDNSAVNLLATAWGAGVVLVASHWWR